MKAEVCARLYNVCGRLEADMEWIDLTWPTRRALIAFARACERHGVERAWIRASHAGTSDRAKRELDAEIEKENE